jgi:L-fuconate dehydratase
LKVEMHSLGQNDGRHCSYKTGFFCYLVTSHTTFVVKQVNLSSKKMEKPTTIQDLLVEDVRFPTSLELDGSDASHPDPDYSAVYVTIVTDIPQFKGFGICFTIGRGNELVLHAVDSLRFLVIGKCIQDVTCNMGEWVKSLAHDGQLRWVGPEKGVIHLAVGGIVNAFWDLWGKIEQKPVWKLLVDMTPEEIVSLVDFRYITDCVTKEEAVTMLRSQVPLKKKREAEVATNGFPAYTTQVGWLGYPDDKIRTLSKHFLERGFDAFKMKVGSDLEDDKRRLGYEFYF